MQRWEFVHNDTRGLPAAAVIKLADLRNANPSVVLATCGEAELRAIVMSLALHQLEDLFGAVPSNRALERLDRSEEHTSELQSLMRISYADFCLKKKIIHQHHTS